MANKITCTCGHSWNKSDSSKKDMRVCHVCGKDNTMKNGGWLDKFDTPKAQVGTLITGTSDLISPVYDIFSKIRNLGTSDYSDKKDFDAAYSAAKKAGEEEFVWNGKRYNTKYAGTPRQEVGTYGVQGKPVDLTGLRSDPSRVNLYPMFGKYLPGHLEASIVDGDGYASINYSSAGNQPWLDVIKPEKGEKAYYVYGANRGKFSEKATSLPLGMYSYIYDGVDDRPSDWELFTNNCADNVCDAFGIPRSRGLQTPKGAIEKIKKAYPTLDVTGRTKDDYDKFIRESRLNSLTKERSKDVLSNADRLLNIYYSPDTPSSSKKDIGYALQRSLINQGYELPKSKTKLSELDTIVGDETLGAIKNWKSKNKKQDGGAVEGRMAGLTDKGFNFNPAWGGAWRDGGDLPKYQTGDTFTPYSRDYLTNFRDEWVKSYNQPIPYALPTDDRFDKFYLEKRATVPEYYETKSGWVRGLGTGMEEYREGDKNTPPKSMGKLAKGYEWVENYRTGPFRDDSQIREYTRLIKSIRNAESRKPVWNRDVKFNFKSGGILQPPMAGADQTVPMYAMGGSIPGAVGFTYARVSGAAPANGPYAKKTKASAQNGQEMKFYQEGLDFTPKTISKNGGWLDKYNEDIPQAQTGFTSSKLLNLLAAEQSERNNRALYNMTSLGARQANPNVQTQPYQTSEKYKKTVASLPRKTQQGPSVQAQDMSREAVRLREEAGAQRRKEEAIQNSALAQSFGALTPGGYNPGVGAIGAEFFANTALAPITGAGRLTQQGLGYNPYGFGESTFGNVLGGLGLVGDIGGIGLIKTLPGSTGIKGTKKTSSLFGKSKPNVGPDEELSILPSGVKSDRHISQDDIQSIFKKEADWLRSDEYLKRRIAATGENPITVKKDVEKAISRFDDIEVNVVKKSKNTSGTYNPYSHDIELSPKLNKDKAIEALDHEIKHALSQLSTTGFSAYKKYPTTTLGNVLTRNFSARKHMKYLNEPWEQQVRKLRLLDFINETQGVPRGQTLTMKNIDQLAEDIKPAIGDEPAGPFAEDLSTRYRDVQQGYISGINEAADKLKFVPQNLLKLKFPFKLQYQGGVRQTLLDQLNKAYAVPGAATVFTLASVLGSGSEEKPEQQQDGGDIPVDPMGYWNPENVGSPVIIPSNVITMEGVDQPLVGVSDTGDVQYMMPGEDYEFDGEYVTEYPVAKKGISVNNADAQPLKKLDQLLNFTNYNKPTKGGWLDKYN